MNPTWSWSAKCRPLRWSITSSAMPILLLFRPLLLAISMQFKRTLGRSPKEAEGERFRKLMEKNVRDAGRLAGVRYTLAAVYLLPETIFRWEVGGEVDTEGRTRLTPAEIAHGPNFSEAWARFVAFAEGLIDLSLLDDGGDTHDSEDDGSPGPPRRLSEPPEMLVVAHNGVRCWDVC